MTNFLKRSSKIAQGMFYSQVGGVVYVATAPLNIYAQAMSRVEAAVGSPIAIGDPVHQRIEEANTFLKEKANHKYRRGFLGRKETERLENRAQENNQEDSNDSIGPGL